MSATLEAFGVCAAFSVGGYVLGRIIRGGRLAKARHEGWMAGHAEGHRKTMGVYAAESAVERARHEGWMEGFDSAASIKLGVFDRDVDS